MTLLNLPRCGDRTEEPEHQGREHPVPCLKRCGRTTWNRSAICDACAAREQTSTISMVEQTNVSPFIVEQAHYEMPERCHGCGTWTLGPAFCSECSAITARAFHPAGTGRRAA